MADYKFDGTELRDRNGGKVAYVQGNDIRDRNGSKVASVQGDDIRDRTGSKIASFDDVRNDINGIGGKTLVAVWYFFVR